MGQRTETGRSELQVPFARLSTPKTCLRELWIKEESAVSALLCKIVSVGISHFTRKHAHSMGETHSVSFSHAAAIFERYKAEGPLIWMATSNSAIASRYFPLRKCAFPWKNEHVSEIGFTIPKYCRLQPCGVLLP